MVTMASRGSGSAGASRLSNGSTGWSTPSKTPRCTAMPTSADITDFDADFMLTGRSSGGPSLNTRAVNVCPSRRTRSERSRGSADALTCMSRINAASSPSVRDLATGFGVVEPADDAGPSQAARTMSRGRIRRIGIMLHVRPTLQPPCSLAPRCRGLKTHSAGELGRATEIQRVARTQRWLCLTDPGEAFGL